MRIKRKQFKEGKSSWNPSKKWSLLFRDYFSGDAEEMMKKLQKNPECCFDFIDEGVDVASWQHMLEKEQKNLIEMILKAGKRKHFTIIITPSMSLFNKTVLAQAHYLFMLIDEPDANGNSAYLFKNYKNPILRERMPFGFKKIEDDALKQSYLANSEAFDNYLQHSNRFIAKFRYRNINPKLYALYDKLVKEPLIMKTREKSRSIPYAKHFKLQYAFDTLLYNLYERDEKTYTQISELLRDKFGNPAVSPTSIKPHIDRILTMTEKPPMEEEEVIEQKPEIDLEEVKKLESELEAEECINENEDVIEQKQEVELPQLEKLESKLEAEEQTNRSKKEINSGENNIG